MMNMITINKKIKKTSQGRKKIEIKKIEEVNNRQVTFSKRRTGIFKKAAELCVLTGCEIAILVNSPGGRVYAFGHPNPDAIIDRYLNTDTAECTTTSTNLNPALAMERFNRFYVEKSMELEAEKRQKEMIREARTEVGDGVPWYHESFAVDGMKVEELVQYLSALVDLKRKVSLRAVEFEMIRKDPKLLGPNMLMPPNMSGEPRFITNEMPNAMVSISSNNEDVGDFGFVGYSHDLDSMMQLLG